MSKLRFWICILVVATTLASAQADEQEFMLHGKTGNHREADYSVISESRWQEIDRSVDRGIEWLVKNQKSDGTYPGPALERTAITSLGRDGDDFAWSRSWDRPRGEAINRSIDYVCKNQKSNGLLSLRQEDFPGASFGPNGITYAHGITGLFLCEVYGMTSGERSERVKISDRTRTRLHADAAATSVTQRSRGSRPWRMAILA